LQTAKKYSPHCPVQDFSARKAAAKHEILFSNCSAKVAFGGADQSARPQFMLQCGRAFGSNGVVARIAYVVLPPAPAEARARAVFDGFQHGTVDRTLFTGNGNAYLSAAALADHKAGLGSLGPARTFSLQDESDRGGMHTRIWKIVTSTATLAVVERGYSGGKLEQFMVMQAQ
jgi:hypothetical protein